MDVLRQAVQKEGVRGLYKVGNHSEFFCKFVINRSKKEKGYCI